jgi:hypothetical protein
MVSSAAGTLLLNQISYHNYQAWSVGIFAILLNTKHEVWVFLPFSLSLSFVVKM